MRLTTTACLLLLLLTPPASAGWFSSDVEITIPPHAVGLTARWDLTTDGEARTSAYLVQAASLGAATDAFGIDRDVVTYHVQSEENGEATWGALCDVLLGGSDLVRMRTVLGAWSNRWERSWSNDVGPVTVSGEEMSSETTYSTGYGGSCDLPIAPAGSYREGQELWLDELWPGAAHASAIAFADEFEGRSALSARFDILGANVTVTLADGLAPIARVTFEGPDSTTRGRLTGLVEGTGVMVPASTGAALPARNPAASFAPATWMGDDLADLPVAYPLPEAIANLRADPQMGLESWLDTHPDAVLVGAYYDRQARNTPVDGDTFDTDGGWGVTFGEGTTWRYWYSSRSSVGHGIGGLLPDAARGVQNFAFDEERLDAATSYHYGIDAYESADVASLLAVAATKLDVGDIEVVEFFRFQQANGPTAYLGLSEVSYSGESEDGAYVQLDMAKGALATLGDTTVEVERTGVLALAPGGVAGDGSGVAAASSPLLGSPVGGVALGVGAAVGLAAIALLLKLVLLPLYSRLRRDRLLDNDVRARLYERVRREPGIHRAELVDYAGIGEGATRHHLAQLVSHRLLVETQVDGFVRYFAAGEVPPAIARRESILRAGSQRAVYELFAASPELSLREAAQRLGMSAPSVHRAKKKLVQAGLLPAAQPVSVAEA